MSDSTFHNVSVADQEKIKKLKHDIEVAEKEIAKTLGAYFGFKDAKVVYDHVPHEPRTAVVRVAEERKLIAVIYSDDGHYGCYYDPPGVAELCE